MHLNAKVGPRTIANDIDNVKFPCAFYYNNGYKNDKINI